MTTTRTARWRYGISVLASTALLACGGESSSSPGAGGATGSGGTTGSSTDVAGTATLPSDATGACAMIAVDDDTTGANDAPYVSYVEVTGTTVAFSFSNVAAGTYYLWSYVDVDGSSSDPASGCAITGAPASGDFLGYYGAVGEPSAPNVHVPNDGAAFDFELGVFP